MFKLLAMLVGVILLCGSITIQAMTDPMQPPGIQGLTTTGSNKIEKPRWVLSSTLVSDGRRLATINGKTLVVGKVIRGGKIIAIKPAAVTILYQGQQVIVKLLPLAFKHQHKLSSE